MLSLFIQISLNNFYFKFSQFSSALWLDVGTYSYEFVKEMIDLNLPFLSWIKEIQLKDKTENMFFTNKIGAKQARSKRQIE